MNRDELIDQIQYHVDSHIRTLKSFPTHFAFLNINDFFILIEQDGIIVEETIEKTNRFNELITNLGLKKIDYINLPNTQGVKCDGETQWTNPKRFMCFEFRDNEPFLFGIEIVNCNVLCKKYEKPYKDWKI